MSVQKEHHGVVVDYGNPAVTKGISVFDPEFDSLFAYEGDDLGVRYTPEATKFRLWAPTASEAKVLLYPVWRCTFAEEMDMTRDEGGTWTLTLEGDYKGIGYNYKVKIGGQWNEGVDPYATAVGINGDRGAIVDMEATNPERWTEDRPPLASCGGCGHLRTASPGSFHSSKERDFPSRKIYRVSRRGDAGAETDPDRT